MAKLPEPTDWNQVAVLLESIDHNVRVVSENMVGMRSEFDTFKMALFDTSDMVKLILPAVQSNTKDIKVIKADIVVIKADIVEINTKVGRIEKRLDAVDSRLTAVEARG